MRKIPAPATASDAPSSKSPGTTATVTTGTTDVSLGASKLVLHEEVFDTEGDLASVALSEEEDEDLDTMAKKIRQVEEQRAESELQEALSVEIDELPTVHTVETTDDFIRNFMFKMGLTRTLDCFETEWYERHQRGLINSDNTEPVPEVHTRCVELEERVAALEMDIQKYKISAEKIKDKFSKVCKERDYHRMHHRRVVQEKNKLLAKIEGIQKHYAEYEPTLKTMQQQYEKAFRDRVLLAMEKDQMATKMLNMQSLVKNKGRTEATRFTSVDSTTPEIAGAEDKASMAKEERSEDSKFPPDEGFNPALAKFKNVVYKKDDFTPSVTLYAHTYGISGVSIHPEENIFVTASDDFTWKSWAVPPSDAVVTGKGHCDWLSDCAIGPVGERLATTSGDGTMKIWELCSGKCFQTFSDHQLAVWCCYWHSCGDFIASASMDCTARIWDLNSVRCRQILRGHKDSVNFVEFLSYSNILLTASSDKVIALWDARTGFCGQKLVGHGHAVTSASFNIRGDTIVSGDARGDVKLWDIRSNVCMHTIELGPAACVNDLSFDPSGSMVALACNDSYVRVYELANKQVNILGEHGSSVNVLRFHQNAYYLITGDNDGIVKIWSLRSSAK